MRYSITASRALVNQPFYDDDDTDDYIHLRFRTVELAAEVAQQLSRQSRHVSLHDNEQRLMGGISSIIASWWNGAPASSNVLVNS